MSIKTSIKIVMYVFVGLAALGIIFLVYANLADQMEASRVEAAIKRDCGLDMEVDPNEIGEPGIVVKNYTVDDIPMELVCYGADTWSCDCAENQQEDVPIAVPTPVE